MAPIQRKTCNQCGKRRALSAFSKQAHALHGVRPKCKDCTKANQAGYRQANRAKKAEYQKRYRAENAEAIAERYKEYQKQYRETHREELAERSCQYYEANREVIREKDRLRYLKSKGK